MDPRQMVALRKALSDGGAPQADGAPDAGPAPMIVQCPGCGEQFDANSPDAQVQDQPQGAPDAQPEMPQ